MSGGEFAAIEARAKAATEGPWKSDGDYDRAARTSTPRRSPSGRCEVAACEKCWTQASFDARLLGGSVVDHYYRLLRENENEHTEDGSGVVL